MSQLSEALRQFDTAYLEKAKNQLIHIIPGDPTFTAHVGAILRALLQFELGQRRAAGQPDAPPDDGPETGPDPHPGGKAMPPDALPPADKPADWRDTDQKAAAKKAKSS
jgi:hypothetical protein